jgi:hypothetical protein
LTSSDGGSKPTTGSTFGDVHALVAHSLHVLDHVQQRRYGPQIRGHRSLKREEGEDPLLDLEIAPVDPVVVLDDDRGELDVPSLQCLERPVERRYDQVETAELTTP